MPRKFRYEVVSRTKFTLVTNKRDAEKFKKIIKREYGEVAKVRKLTG